MAGEDAISKWAQARWRDDVGILFRNTKKTVAPKLRSVRPLNQGCRADFTRFMVEGGFRLPQSSSIVSRLAFYVTRLCELRESNLRLRKRPIHQA
jgi:hypothetical protein